MKNHKHLKWIGYCLLACAVLAVARNPAVAAPAKTLSVPLVVTSELPFPKVPMDPMIDFTSLIAKAGAEGVLDPNTIEVVDVKTGQVVPHSLSEDFNHGDKGRVLWLIEDPAHTKYEIRFQTAAKRPLLAPQKHIPMIGVGDLLHYNAGTPRPSVLRWPSRLVDLTGDGKLDLVGTMPHFFAPPTPPNKAIHCGIVCYPGVGSTDRFEFGDMVRLRYLDHAKDREFKYFGGPSQCADVADVNGDGLPDLLYTCNRKAAAFSRIKDIHKYVSIYLNSGKKDAGGMPIFIAGGRLPLPPETLPGYWSAYWWGPIRAVDLNRDGAMDLVFGRLWAQLASTNPDTNCIYLKNTNPKGWPMQFAEPVEIDAGCNACFYDVDGDGLLDAVGLLRDPKAVKAYRGDVVTWRKNLGGDPPRFGPVNRFADQDLRYCEYVSAVNTKNRRGLLLGNLRNHDAAFLEQVDGTPGTPRFGRRQIVSDSAVVVAGDQASPYPCDWDADGDWDLVVGCGDGWPQVIINEGSNSRPAFASPQQILSQGEPIRIFMSQVFPGIRGYIHDMGYPFPSYIDWDADGLPDLMMPNLSNRVFWYKNIGTRQQPKFGPRRQVIVDGYPETAETLAATAKLLGAGTKNWAKRMLDPNSPFGWRARAGFGDLNGDGLVDMVHADGRTQNVSGYADVYSLFVQYRDADGKLKLRRDGVITHPDGSPLKGPGFITSQALVTDWDGDGLLDIIAHWGEMNIKCQPMFVRNIGTKTKPKFDYPKPICLWGKPLKGLMKHGPYWGFHDIDEDGRLDLLAGCCYGNYAFYRRTALEMKERPRFQLGAPRQLEKGTR